MAKKKTIYECMACGATSPKWMGRCSHCGAWNQIEEVTQFQESTKAKAKVSQYRNQSDSSEVLKLSEVTKEDVSRKSSHIKEFDRVLGGGIVDGSLVLIGGDPGIGKSTLLLQASAKLSQQYKVLYISGEESVRQTKLRADRLTEDASELYVHSETNLDVIHDMVKKHKPDFLIVDSIQTVHHPEVESAPGSVSQVRECTHALMTIAKTEGIATFIVGHVTKEGQIAGPRMLEHMVDTVLYFEGDTHHSYRILRAVKNRFGSTHEMGIFEMKQSGLTEVINPSQMFLEERGEHVEGSTVVATMEGTRPLLVEVQALISPTTFHNPRRMATGIDYNRLNLLMAVLEKKQGLLMQQQDAYLKVAGGVKLDEPAVDLSIIIAIASSFKSKATKPHDCYVGEVGLTGEVRRVARIEQRIQEALKLGFKRIIIPKHNMNEIERFGEIEVLPVQNISEALKIAFESQ